MASARDRPRKPGTKLSNADALALALCERWLDKLHPEVVGLYRGQHIGYDDAQDLTSKAFERAWKWIDRYPALRVEAAVRSVTFKMATKVLKDFNAKEKKEKAREFVLVDEDVELESSDDLQALMEGKDAEAAADAAMSELADQQEVVIRLVVEGYTVSEIADRISSAFNSAKTQVSRARKKLKLMTRLKLILKDAGFDVPDETSQGGLDDE